MDNRNLAVKALVGVSVLFGGCTVGGPAGVGDADMAMERLVFEFVFKGGNLAGSTNGLDFAVFDEGNARAVVATVFQFLESTNQDG